jgi:hypothetical protein
MSDLGSANGLFPTAGLKFFLLSASCEPVVADRQHLVTQREKTLSATLRRRQKPALQFCHLNILQMNLDKVAVLN